MDSSQIITPFFGCVRLARTALVISTALILSACESSTLDASRHVSWRIVDSTWAPPWDPMDDSIAVYRVAVRHDQRTDTLRDVIGPWPVVAGDSAVFGLFLDRQDTTRRIFIFDAHSAKTRTTDLPTDLFSNFTDYSISPDGRFVAYVGDSSAYPRAVVRTFGGELIVQGRVQSGCDCDVDLNHARWVSPDSFEIAIVNRANADHGAPYVLAAGSARGRRLREVGLPDEPKWHEGSRP